MTPLRWSLLLVLCYSVLHGQTEGIFENNGANIYYRSFGQGKPILIINGGPGFNSNGFESLARKLSTHHRTIIYDQRGTGKSTVNTLDSSTITMDSMVADIECLRNRLGIKTWAVLGHSFGGMLASYYATKFPARIDGLILSSSGGIDLELLSYAGKSINARLTKSELDSVEYWNDKISNGDTSYFARYHRGMALAPAYLYDRTYVPTLAERLTQGNEAVLKLVWSDLIRIKFNCASGLKQFKKPVLIIQGRQDIVKKETALKAHRSLINSKVVILDKCGHYGWLDQEKEYFKNVEALLRSIAY